MLAQASNLTGAEAWFVGLVDRALASPALAVLAALAALGVGAVHALAPGHGKAVVAAYLVGQRGRFRDAFVLGAAVAGMHLVSVVALAAALGVFLRASTQPAGPPNITPELRIASGAMVLGLGCYLVWRQVVRRSRSNHGHDHAVDGAVPVSRPGLVVLGLAGGLLPSPSAFLVLVTAAFSGRLWFGLLLVALFSVGLAATLTLLGLAVVRGRRVLVDRLSGPAQQRFLRAAGIGGAVAVLVGGGILTAAGVLAL